MPDGGRIINISSRACLGFWGAVDFRQAGRCPSRCAWFRNCHLRAGRRSVYAAGQHILGWFLGLASISYHASCTPREAGCSKEATGSSPHPVSAPGRDYPYSRADQREV